MSLEKSMYSSKIRPIDPNRPCDYDGFSLNSEFIPFYEFLQRIGINDVRRVLDILWSLKDDVGQGLYGQVDDLNDHPTFKKIRNFFKRNPISDISLTGDPHEMGMTLFSQTNEKLKELRVPLDLSTAIPFLRLAVKLREEELSKEWDRYEKRRVIPTEFGEFSYIPELIENHGERRGYLHVQEFDLPSDIRRIYVEMHDGNNNYYCREVIFPSRLDNDLKLSVFRLPENGQSVKVEISIHNNNGKSETIEFGIENLMSEKSDLAHN